MLFVLSGCGVCAAPSSSLSNDVSVMGVDFWCFQFGLGAARDGEGGVGELKRG